MKDNDLQKELMPFIRDVSQGILSAASCIRNHTPLILSLRSKGYSVKHIVAISGISYSTIQFSNKLSECKKKLAIKLEEKPIFINNAITTSKNIEPINLKKEKKKITESISDDYTSKWIKAFAFTTSFNTKVLVAIVPTLEKAGWNPENYYILKDQFSILTFSQLNKVIGNIRSSQFKKVIFKDGQPIF
jgi:hypothetical protein